jgi:hypothetical protein
MLLESCPSLETNDLEEVVRLTRYRNLFNANNFQA